MTYSKQTWVNGEGGGTPVDATRLNHMEDGINGSGNASIFVAASDAPPLVKARSDFVCDGVNDDVQVQAAVDLATDSNPACVQLSAGNFVFGNDVTAVVTAVSILGTPGVNTGTDGIGGNSAIISASGYNGPLFTLGGGILAALEDLTLNTDDAGPSGASGLIVISSVAGGSSRVSMRNVYVENDYGVAVYSVAASGESNYIFLDHCDFEGDDSALRGSGATITRLVATNCFFYAYSTGYAVDINEATNNGLNISMDHCYCEGPGGIRVLMKTGSGDVQLTNIKCLAYNSLPAVYVGNTNSGTEANRVTGVFKGTTSTVTDLVTFDSCAHLVFDIVGIQSGGHGLRINACNDMQGSLKMLNAGQTTDNTYSGLIIDGSSARVNIGPIHIRSTTANKALYGVRINSGSVTKANIHDAMLIGASKTGGNEISDTGTGTTQSNVVTS